MFELILAGIAFLILVVAILTLEFSRLLVNRSGVEWSDMDDDQLLDAANQGIKKAKEEYRRRQGL